MSHKPLDDEPHGDIILCAGLPFTGFRTLNKDEQNHLQSSARRQFITIILWFALIPIWFGAPVLLLIVLSLIINDTYLLEGIIATVAIVSVVFGTAFSLFRADLAWRRYRVLKRTVSIGNVRCFEGKITDEDWTSDAYEVLMRAGLLDENIQGESKIELHAVNDVVYQVQGVKPQKWLAIELTRAASPPNSPARFIAPDEWLIPEIEGEVLRRRLTPGERDEVLQYARDIQKRFWLLVLALAWFLAVTVNALVTKLLLLERQTGIAIWAAATVIISALLYYRQKQEADLYKQDSDYGWTVIIAAKKSLPPKEDVHDLTAELEVLPISGTVWMINRKPAGWRKRV